MTYCKPTQKTFKGKGPAHYIDNATVAVAESGNYELFYGKDIVLLLNASNNLVVVGAGGTLAVLDGLSRRSISKARAMLEEAGRLQVSENTKPKEETKMAIININESYGDPIQFGSVEEMAQTIIDCGYDLPEGGLIEGGDYEVVKE